MKSIKIEIQVEETVTLMPEWMEILEKHVREKWDMLPSESIHEQDLVAAAVELGYIEDIPNDYTTVEDNVWTVEDFQSIKNGLANEQKRQAKNLRTGK